LPEGDVLNAMGERAKPPFGRTPTTERTRPSFKDERAQQSSNRAPPIRTAATFDRDRTRSRRPFQARPGASNLSLDPNGRTPTASLFGAEATPERPPNLVGVSVPQLDQNGKPYICYNCGRPGHIANGCKYHAPVEGSDGDKPRALRHVASVRDTLKWVHDIREQGVPDNFKNEAYCMWLHEAKGAMEDLIEAQHEPEWYDEE
jgi:hypothetical protein